MVRKAFALIATSWCVAQAAPPPNPAPPREVLDKYCVTCHNQRLKTAGLTLDTADVSNVAGNAEVWEKVIRKLRAGAMPPGAARPDPPPTAHFNFAPGKCRSTLPTPCIRMRAAWCSTV